jgi:cobalt-zinc-cadmium efflux system protein
MHSHHHHGHTHHDGHCHHDDDPNTPQRRAEKLKKLKWALVLTAVYFWAELIGGWLSGSLALLADSGHMFSDMAGIGLAVFAAWASQLKTSSRQTYGLYRLEVLVAFVNGLLLAGIAFLILNEAWQRFSDPHTIDGPMMMWIAIGGLIINLMVMKSLHGDHQHDLNMKGAYLHVLGDLLGSIGTIIAAGCLTYFGWAWADPVISAVIAVLVLISALQLLLDASHILLENSPAHVDVDEVNQAIGKIEGVLAIHDLHVWTISSYRHALSAHVTVTHETDHPTVLTAIQTTMGEQFGLNHVTIQLEPPGFADDCHGC